MKKKETYKEIMIYPALNKNKCWICQAKSGEIKFRGDFGGETIWGSLNQIADLFDVQKAAISKHLKNIYKDGELDKKATVSILETVQTEGQRQVKRDIEYYNLDAIISVGYRVNSKKATEFRIWATKTLKQHITKGFTINKKLLEKNHKEFLKVADDIKLLAKRNTNIKTEDIVDLIKSFAGAYANYELLMVNYKSKLVNS